MDSLLDKHSCFKYCFCEGRTGNGIETINAYSSLFYIVPAICILTTTKFKSNLNNITNPPSLKKN